MNFSLKLKKPLHLKRRILKSPDLMRYDGELVMVLEGDQVGYGELIQHRQLAKEMAYLNILFQSHPQCVETERVPVAAMFDQINSHTLLEVQDCIARGYKTLKFKISHDWEVELEHLSDI